MRVSISRGLAAGDDIFDPGDPPTTDIDDLFELEIFQVSRTNFLPFEDVEIEWSIRSRDPDNRFEDYIFDVVETAGVVSSEIAPAGSVTINPFRNTLLRITGRRRGGGSATTLGEGIALKVDDAAWETVDLVRGLFDGIVYRRFGEIIASQPEVRLRRITVPTGTGFGGTFEVVDAEPSSEWTTQAVNYHFPLELILEGFFNARLDLDLKLEFRVHHDGANSDLEVTLTHDTDISFTGFQDTITLGRANAIANNIEKFMPTIMNCLTRGVEREIIDTILDLGGVKQRLDRDFRLLGVRIAVNGALSALLLVFCPPPDRSDDDRPGTGQPDAPGTGGVG